MRSNLVYAAPVVDKPLRISGRGDATVKPSAMLDNTTSLTTGNPIAAGILVKDTSGVTIESLAVDGAGNGGIDCTRNPVGIYFRNASGTIRATSSSTRPRAERRCAATTAAATRCGATRSTRRPSASGASAGPTPFPRPVSR